jgi:short-subunit dehydrogenase
MKIILVGASSGIGRELALYYARQGHDVGITARREPLLTEMQQQYPDRIRIACFDVTELGTTNEQLQLLADQLGGLDLLIYNAGIGIINKAFELGVEQQMVQLNVVAFTQVTNWAIHYFQKQRSGHFVSISSVAALRGNGLAPAYGASKAFQSNYMEGLQHKISKSKQTGIYITDIRPGFVDTPMTKQNPVMFWVATPQKAAQQIAYAIAARKRVAYITRRWVLVAILMRLVPRWLYLRT